MLCPACVPYLVYVLMLLPEFEYLELGLLLVPIPNTILPVLYCRRWTWPTPSSHALKPHDRDLVLLTESPLLAVPGNTLCSWIFHLHTWPTWYSYPMSDLQLLASLLGLTLLCLWCWCSVHTELRWVRYTPFQLLKQSLHTRGLAHPWGSDRSNCRLCNLSMGFTSLHWTGPGHQALCLEKMISL